MAEDDMKATGSGRGAGACALRRLVRADASGRDCRCRALPPALARALFPRGGVDLALAYHARGDAAMVARLAATDLTALRFRDRIALAVRARLELADRELVRRGTTLFSLPQHAADGARAIWGTADAIWTALGRYLARSELVHQARHACRRSMARPCCYWLGDDIVRPSGDLGFSGPPHRTGDAVREAEGQFPGESAGQGAAWPVRQAFGKHSCAKTAG